jgi:alpha,alpha-trehalase
MAKDSDVDLCERSLVPTAAELSLVEGFKAQTVRYQEPLSSPGVNDPWLKLGRAAVAYPDFKFLSDLQRLPVSERERAAIIQAAKKFRREIFDKMNGSGMEERKATQFAQRAYARYVINHLFTFKPELKPLEDDSMKARFTVKDPRYKAAFDHAEATWSQLTRQSPEFSRGSLLPTPYPVVVAGGRFRETYYWDAYFGALGLVATGRTDLAAAQLENFLHMIQVFGKIPNGFRDYYLTRSQPPVISMLTMLIYEQRPNLEWLEKRAFPLLQHDYHNFWMKRRYDEKARLNFYSDDLNAMRPERHSADNERTLGRTFRDVRAQAESGLDHTDALMEGTSRVASVSLNAFLYRYEMDLAKMADLIGKPELALRYRAAASHRRLAMFQLWDEEAGAYRNMNLDDRTHSPVLHADMFTALYSGVATPAQAERMAQGALAVLEREGGLASSTSQSGKQWDGDHGWAPLNVMAIQGLWSYGFLEDARRLARKWVDSLAAVHRQTGNFYEKIDVSTAQIPVENGAKYPTQTGFLWTNASFVWALRFLGHNLDPIPQ